MWNERDKKQTKVEGRSDRTITKSSKLTQKLEMHTMVYGLSRYCRNATIITFFCFRTRPAALLTHPGMVVVRFLGSFANRVVFVLYTHCLGCIHFYVFAFITWPKAKTETICLIRYLECNIAFPFGVYCCINESATNNNKKTKSNQIHHIQFETMKICFWFRIRCRSV